MNSNKITILEFPTNLGLRKRDADTEPGVKKLPDWLKKHGFHKRVNAERTLRLEPPAYAMDFDKVTGVRNADKIINYAIEQAKIVSEHLEEDVFQISLGGDCSILIGTAIALKQKGNYGLFFLDGHTDFITSEISQTGGVAGMDLAIVTGNGHDTLTNITGLEPYFEEKNVFCVGNREYDTAYVRPILESGITYFDLKRLQENGFTETAKQFLEMVEINKLDGFFIHLDVDVLNDEIMPAVDCRANDGLTFEAFKELLKPLLLSPKAVGIEITILDPNLDADGTYTKQFIKHFLELVDYGKAKTVNT
ncbi:arginase family protein [Flavimarina sp. Hel_I_48]|uniref:arginase family protein n=1 Tax=Flavimarina sp. Hel_I_48 TaxID=1392488 RepID=UPI0004DF8502|nr:arginase family protein [Flavimarina sp. Hel_I_48]